MRKNKADKTVQGIWICQFIQYFQWQCLSLSGCYKLWLSETCTLQFKSNSQGKWTKIGNEKFLSPFQFLCGSKLPGEINRNNHIWIGRCSVAMVTTLDHVDQTSIYWPKNSLPRNKINESGSRVHMNQFKWNSYSW